MAQDTDKSLATALNAAWAVSEDERWFFAGAAINKKTDKAGGDVVAGIALFVRAHRDAPPEALFIRMGALAREIAPKFAPAPWDALAPPQRLAFTVFRDVLNAVDGALAEVAQAARSQEEAQARAALQPKATREDLEGTPLEEIDDPLAPSTEAKELARREARNAQTTVDGATGPSGAATSASAVDAAGADGAASRDSAAESSAGAHGALGARVGEGGEAQPPDRTGDAAEETGG